MTENQQPTRRQRQATQTRREIIDAARLLFAEQGYAKTSVNQIAERAGVSVQTIYDSLGSKAAIVRSLNDLIDDEGDVALIVPQIFAADDPRRTIELATSISKNICERCTDLMRIVLSAAGAEAELAAVYAESMRRHRDGIRHTCGRLASMKAFRRGVTIDHAIAVMGALSEPTVIFTFVDGYGWTFEQWHKWATSTLCDLLLKPQ